MKTNNLLKKLIAVILCMTLLLSILPSTNVQAASNNVSLKHNNITLYVGTTTKVSLNRTKGVTIKKVTYSSNKKSIATVTSKGKITAKKVGKAYIYSTVKYVKNKKAYTAKLKTTVVVKRCPHKKFVTIKTIKPTCTKSGKKQIKCKQCGYIKTTTIKATGHKYNKGIVTKSATCKTTGTKVYTCTICKHKKSVVIPKTTTHKWNSTFTIDKQPTKTSEGSKSIHCSICNIIKSGSSVKIPKLVDCNHVYDKGIVTKEATCTSTGIKTYTCTICKNKKLEVIPALEHDYTDWTITKEPTCTEPGEKQRICKLCNNIEKTSVDTIEHSWGVAKNIKLATCTSEGEASYTCTKCGYTETRTITKKDHDWIELTSKRVNPTCKHTGNISYICKVCNTTKDEEIAKLDHKYEWSEKLAPTFWETGVKLKKCSLCGLEDTSTYTCIDSVRYVHSEDTKSFKAYSSGYMMDFQGLENTYNYVESICKSRANNDYYGGKFYISTAILVKSNSDTKRNQSINFSISENYDQRILNTFYPDSTTGHLVYFKFDLNNPDTFDEIFNNSAVLNKYGSSVINDLKEHKDKLWAYNRNIENYSYYIDVRLLSAIVTYMGKDVIGYTPDSCIRHIGNNVNSTSTPYLYLHKIIK